MNFFSRLLIGCRNRILDNGFGSVFSDPTLRECMRDAPARRGGIEDHLCTMFSDLVAREPSLIVELGSRTGVSTRALIAAASYTGARVLSVDTEPRPVLHLPPGCEGIWDFVQSDDLAFAQKGFRSWCEANGLEPSIDALFIDTSHEYEHTRREIEAWFQFVPRNGIVIFHDTNMASAYRRLNNRVGIGWDNARGVIRAIEEYLGREYDESQVFVDVTEEWLVRHYPYSSGLTYLKRRRLSS